MKRIISLLLLLSPLFAVQAYAVDDFDISANKTLQSSPNYTLRFRSLWNNNSGPITDRNAKIFETYTDRYGVSTLKNYKVTFTQELLNFSGRPDGSYAYKSAEVCTTYLGTTTQCSTVTLTTVINVKSGVATVVVDEARSLFVRDNATLSVTGITLPIVMQRLADQLNISNPADKITGEQLFARMWSTQRAPECTGVLNGFQTECRPVEASQADNPSGQMASYRLIALVNRFDLRDTASFSHCGESRMVFGRTDNSRNFIIFEAQLPNPGFGKSGCLPIANFWSSLSTIADANLRASNLARFYLEGISSAGVGPVVHANNYAANRGQIRVNMFMSGDWLLKEFKVDVSRNKIAPVTVKNNPFGELFSASRTDSLAVNFKNTFLANLSSLLTDRDSLSINVGSDSFNNGESHASGSDTQENNFAGFVGTQFRSDIQNRATALGSSLTSNQVIARATALTCGGCHQPAAFGLTAPNSIGLNQNWPDSLGFVHVSERIGADGKFPISPALQTVFIPARKKDFEGYLNSPN